MTQGHDNSGAPWGSAIDMAGKVRNRRPGHAVLERGFLSLLSMAGLAGTLILINPASAQTGEDPPICADRPGEAPEMVIIPAGRFLMGSPEDEPQRDDDEGPRRWVTVQPFALARCEVTVADFRRFVAETGYETDAEREGGCAGLISGEVVEDASISWRSPGWPQREQHPVTCISWNDAQAYLAWLSVRTGQQYRLPSEAEWEYAARAGSTTRFHTGDCITTDQANFDGNFPAEDCPEGQYREETIEVGSFAPNDFGLYDMHGNVWEWVADCWNDSYERAPDDGSAWRTGDCGRAVLRGGSWSLNGRFLRSAARSGLTRAFRGYFTGFRPARSVAL